MLIQILFVCVTMIAYTGAQECCANKINKEYRLETKFKANWYDAYIFCRYNGMQLATIHSEQEQSAIDNLLLVEGLKNETFWISLTDIAKEGTFQWFSSGNTISSYSNWLPNQPDNYKGAENCVCLERNGNGKWQDGVCDLLFYFICERSL